MGGYAGNLLYIDLTSGKIQIKPLDMAFARENIGGLGVWNPHLFRFDQG